MESGDEEGGNFVFFLKKVIYLVYLFVYECSGEGKEDRIEKVSNNWEVGVYSSIGEEILFRVR